MTDDLDDGFAPRPGFTQRFSPAKGQADAQEFAAGISQYKPYGYMPSNSAGETCEVRSWVDGTEVPEGVVFQYRFLMNVGFVGEETLRLMLPDTIVVIDGKRLLDLRQKLSRRVITTIQQYNPRIWPAPPGDEPLIERIEIVRPETFQSRA